MLFVKFTKKKRCCNLLKQNKREIKIKQTKEKKIIFQCITKKTKVNQKRQRKKLLLNFIKTIQIYYRKN